MAVHGTKNNKKHAQKHRAIYSGKKYNLSSTDWSRMIDCPISQVDRGLKLYGSMQAYLDKCHAETQRRDRLYRRFVFGGVCHG